MKQHLIVILISLLVVSSVAATGMLIKAHAKESGFNDAAFYAYQEGKSGAAEQLYLRAIAENPEYDLARYNLATFYFQEKRFDDAIAQLDFLVAAHPEDPRYHYDLAVNLIENIRQNEKGLDQFDRALAEYKTTASLAPSFAHVQENIAVLEKIKMEFNIA